MSQELADRIHDIAATVLTHPVTALVLTGLLTHAVVSWLRRKLEEGNK